MTLATEGEIGLPKRQYCCPFCPCLLAQVANSSGVGLWPRSAAQRRTMKPSIIFGALSLELPKPSISNSIENISDRCKKFCHRCCYLNPSILLWSKKGELIILLARLFSPRNPPISNRSCGLSPSSVCQRWYIPSIDRRANSGHRIRNGALSCPCQKD